MDSLLSPACWLVGGVSATARQSGAAALDVELALKGGAFGGPSCSLNSAC